MKDLIGLTKLPQNIDGLLLPVGVDTLLVPMTCVAEIIEERPALTRSPQSKPWLHGWIDWRKQHIPLLAFEGLEGIGPMPLTETSQIIIFNAIGVGAERGFFALAIDNLPRPMRLSEEQDLPIASSPERTGIAFATTIEDKPVLIPDLEYLEQLSVEAALEGSIA